MVSPLPVAFPLVYLCVQLLSRVRLFATPCIVACQAPLSKGFSRQEYWSGLPFPSPGDLLDPGIQPMFPAFAGRFFTTEPLGKPHTVYQDSFLLKVFHWLPAVYGSLSSNVSIWSTHFLSSDTSFISCLFLVSTLHLNYTQLLSCLLALILLAFDPLFLGMSLLPCLPTKLLFLPTDSES